MSTEQTPRSTTMGRDYLRWLEGVRAICALYVVFHHIYIGTIPGYAQGQGYFYLNWLVFGQLAVVAFIVVSGFSLGLKPARTNFVLEGGAMVFFQRRAWRILPPYWIALILAMAYHLIFLREDVAHAVNLRSFFVHALLLQDILRSNSPNGAFWSIAVEAQIYIIFPAALIFCRLGGWMLAISALCVATVCVHIAATHFAMLQALDHLSPQLFVGFIFGLAAAVGSLKRRRWNFMRPVALCLALGLFLVLSLRSIAWVTSMYFWIDIAFAALIAQCFVFLDADDSIFRRILASPILCFIGAFSYSLYLTHLVVLHPILVALTQHFSGGQLLSLMYCFGLPATLIFAFIFYHIFEKPFLSIRSWEDLRTSIMGSSRRSASVRIEPTPSESQNRS